MIIIIAKNQTANDVIIGDLAVTVPASGEFDLTMILQLSIITNSSDLNSLIENDTLLLNDGTNDLTKQASCDFVKQWSTRNAFDAICLKSPNGTAYAVSVDDAGNITTTAA